MEFKAKITHAVKEDGRPYKARTIRADIDKVESSNDIADNKWPFYYQIGSVASPSISCQNNMVTLASAGAESIYYTMDGTAPDKSKTKYSGPFAISQTVTVKAIAYLGDLSSLISSQECTYTAQTESEVVG